MEPKPEQITAKPVQAQAAAPQPLKPAVEQVSKAVAPSTTQTVPVPAAKASPQTAAIPAKSAADSTKKPVVAIVLSALIFVGLAVFAYYAYSKSR